MTALLVASAGGHLSELHGLAARLDLGADRVWVTTETAQTRSMLAGEQVRYVGPTPSRDVKAVARNAVRAREILAEVRPSLVVSTGSSIALSFLPLAAAAGTPCHYIESAARLAGPSATGRLLAGVPGVRLHTQSMRWAGRRWSYAGSVFDGFVAEPGARRPLRSVVVTVGSSRYGFRRLVDRVQAVVPSTVEVVWQTGTTAVNHRGVSAQPSIAWAELHARMAAADVVVSHAGVGSALDVLRAGRCPVLAPRRVARGEHVDDHQTELAEELGRRGLAVVADAWRITRDDLERAAAIDVRRTDLASVADRLRLDA